MYFPSKQEKQQKREFFVPHHLAEQNGSKNVSFSCHTIFNGKNGSKNVSFSCHTKFGRINGSKNMSFSRNDIWPPADGLKNFKFFEPRPENGFQNVRFPCHKIQRNYMVELNGSKNVRFLCHKILNGYKNYKFFERFVRQQTTSRKAVEMVQKT